MATWLCEGTGDDPCGTLYAVGLFRCPRCHGTRFHEFGSRPGDEEHPMAKITRLGGPSDKTLTPDDGEPVAEREAPGIDNLAAEAVEHPPDGTWSPEITGDGSGEALPPADVDAPLVPPDGTIEAVIAWVQTGGQTPDDPDDPFQPGWADRARAALDAENAKGDKARPRLVTRLEAILHADDLS